MEIVNDEYWLNYAKSSVESSLTSRNKAAAKLEKMTLWFWGIYTATFTFGVTINALDAPWVVLAMLASPIVLLIITYWFSVLAQLPVNAEFDPRIPYEIKDAFNAGLKTKNKRFKAAKWFTFLSAAMLSISLFSLSFVQKKENSTFNAEFIQEDSVLLVSGVYPKGMLITAKVDSVYDANKKNEFYKNSFRIGENETLNINVPIKIQPNKTLITIICYESGIEKGSFITIKKDN